MPSKPRSSSSDDFELIYHDTHLPVRVKHAAPPPEYEDILTVKGSLIDGDELLISIDPPKQPKQDCKHASCDIVLVIDVSGSMNEDAPLPDAQDKDEKSGLSVLDLTRHAARTVMESLDEKDRLAVVTFSRDATTLQQLIPMTKENKLETQKRLTSMEPLDATNLWSGIRTGLDLFGKASKQDNVPAMLVLTDGMPNFMCPSQGYVNKLRPMLEKMEDEQGIAPTIHTFGFGYAIRSDLMHSIAEVSRGSYCFIPDAGMIGTAFVHAIANLFSTYTTTTRLELTISQCNVEIDVPSFLEQSTLDTATTIQLGNVRYGQSRDVLLRIKGGLPVKRSITIHVTGKLGDRTGVSAACTVQSSSLKTKTSDMSAGFVAYHRLRQQICQNIASLYPRIPTNERASIKAPALESYQALFGVLVDSAQSTLKSLKPGKATLDLDIQNYESLLEDLNGQIKLALRTDNDSKHSGAYYERWGRHYLASILYAHMQQMCNTFKDPGPLRYGVDSPLFRRCRDELDSLFDNLPPPKPTKKVTNWGNVVHGHAKSQRSFGGVHTMRIHNSSSNPCFLGSCFVTLADGSKKCVDQLQADDLIETLCGPRLVRAVVETHLPERQQLCTIGSLTITPWHPIKSESSENWLYPIDHEAVETRESRWGETVFSVLLEADENAQAHTIEIEGITCTTLGHGLVSENVEEICRSSDVRPHSFFGDYNAVCRSLAGLALSWNGHLLSRGVQRNEQTGLVCGFVPTKIGKLDSRL